LIHNIFRGVAGKGVVGNPHQRSYKKLGLDVR
jgi:hypothetical protein